MDNFKIYKIRCLTNMHVGNGDASYTLIDKQVQKDVITGFPSINSSSLKGSLRNFLDPENKKNDTIKYIFGDEKEGIGKYKFFGASLLSIPVRSDVKPFFRATCPRIIKDFIDFIENFECNLEYSQDLKKVKRDLEKIKKVAEENKNSISILKEFNSDIKETKMKVEGINAILKEALLLEDKRKIENIFGENLIIIDDKTFYEIVDALPVIARNKLDNGESENLWYEEVVPRESRFYFGVILGEECQDEFKKITKQAVQIGGNATIGYGYCDIQSI